MRSTRIAISAAILGALALPIASATTATAAPTATPGSAPSTRPCDQPGPWVTGTKAVNIRSQASAKSTSLGILYRSHTFTVHKTSGYWHYITDKTTGVKGWVSGTYVYRDVRLCLD
ncbi:SH3 domain-containing protein [Streptomyces ipomoeae]|uniref:SH3 domain-containing protein n=1 Tax=Streptomyces ipomoeae TaxID=103232 RepID=UPI0029AAA281|nr:SH3 domain-containing protein [Streptomyces ipomoeae]MDX2821048.1 SH3 domain-containing protein [Streptomyces ipomoeae]MDX2876400.1 SH3 domain-containing protein [Streptomyces ipomoeae]